MKHLFIFLCISFAIWSCNNDKKEAEAKLDQALAFYENNEWEAAKQELDSLKVQYPKQVESLKKGLELSRNIELKEKERNIIYCDSLIKVKQEEAKKLSGKFIMEKDAEYQNIGTWVHKSQKVERNVERSYIRNNVNEKGEYALVSVYFGKGPIQHHSLKVSTKDGSFAQTEIVPRDGGRNFSFTDNGNTTEIVTYNTEKDGGVSAFICQHPNDRIKIEYQGRKNYIIYLNDKDRKALMETFEYASVLNEIERLKKEIEKSEVRIEYLKQKLSQQNETISK